MMTASGLYRKFFVAAALCAFAIVPVSCGGGGSSSHSYSSYTTPSSSSSNTSQPINIDSGTSAKKTVAIMLRIPNATSMSDTPIVGVTGAARAAASNARSAPRSAASTKYINNEYDPESGCYTNGSMTVTPTSSSSAEVYMAFTQTSCNDPELNGDYSSSGTMTLYSSSSAYFNLTNTFSPEDSELNFSFPMKGTYYSNYGTFNPSGTFYVSVSGKDGYGTQYKNLTFTESSDGYTVTGKIKDTSGLELTFLEGTILNDDDSFDIVLKTNNDLKVVMSIQSSGAGTAKMTQFSSGTSILDVSWNTSGAGTITYANGSTASFNANSI